MMKSFIGSCLVAAIFVGSPVFVSQTQESSKRALAKKSQESAKTKQVQEEKRKVDGWMKAKRDHSHKIFDGLIAGDFKKVEDASLKMIGNNFLEGWLADREQYEKHFSYHGQLNAFEYSTKELWRFAKQKDMDGALQAYGVMSRSCVRCHQLIRDGVVPPDTLKDLAMNSRTQTPAKVKNN